MKNFYIFLDIDGVMYDYEYIKTFDKKNSKLLKTFKPESVAALNHIIQILHEKYNVILVITSTWRKFMPKCKQLLINNGVNLDLISKLDQTPISTRPHLRGHEIFDFLSKRNEEKTNNYVIIDDELLDYLLYFSSLHIIKTNIFNAALSKSQVKQFIDYFEGIKEK